MAVIKTGVLFFSRVNSTSACYITTHTIMHSLSHWLSLSPSYSKPSVPLYIPGSIQYRSSEHIVNVGIAPTAYVLFCLSICRRMVGDRRLHSQLPIQFFFLVFLCLRANSNKEKDNIPLVKRVKKN